MSAVAGVAVLACAAYLAKDLAIEEWHLRKLRSESPEEQRAAIEKLAALRSARAAPRLLRLPLEDPGLESPCCWALLQIGEKAVPALVSALEDRSAAERALTIIIHLGPRAAAAVPALVEGLKTDCPKPLAVVAALEAIGPGAVPALAAALRPDPAAGWVPFTALRILTRLGPRAEAAVPSLVEVLDQEDPAMRIGACHALGWIGPKARAALPALRKAQAGEDRALREAAGKAIASIEGGRPPRPSTPVIGFHSVDGR